MRLPAEPENVTLEGRAYLLVLDAMSWGGAKAYCAARGMALAGLASSQEAAAVNTAMAPKLEDLSTYYWIGEAGMSAR